VTTTNKVTLKEPAAWLNLDAIVPPEFRERIAGEIAETERLAKEVGAHLARLSDLRDEYDAARQGQLDVTTMVDGLAVYCDLLTGWWHINEAVGIIAGSAVNLLGGTPSDEDYEVSCDFAHVPTVRDHTWRADADE
jgi:hypothetical protein